ncbi:isoprenylcysteine carboxylmethyltransferase family protein [Flavobacterium sp.]|uniref:methyltransferase family protein n=1 Tax=Flavobacterium sp. TaxID=239 RepID=UPI003527667D
MILFAFLFGYVTLVIELVFFHVPSVANTSNFFVKNKNYPKVESALIQTIYRWSFAKKVILLFIPTILVNSYFLFPFFYFYPMADSFQIFKPAFELQLLGVLFVLLGRAITFGSMLYIRKENKQKNDSFKLHTNGIFKYTRNPGLDGMFLFFIGFGLIFPTYISWIGLVGYFVYMLFRVRIEEEFLKELFKQEYTDYCVNTKRFLLF